MQSHLNDIVASTLSSAETYTVGCEHLSRVFKHKKTNKMKAGLGGIFQKASRRIVCHTDRAEWAVLFRSSQREKDTVRLVLFNRATEAHF